jgi:hypothetical protein
VEGPEHVVCWPIVEADLGDRLGEKLSTSERVGDALRGDRIAVPAGVADSLWPSFGPWALRRAGVVATMATLAARSAPSDDRSLEVGDTDPEPGPPGATPAPS